MTNVFILQTTGNYWFVWVCTDQIGAAGSHFYTQIQKLVNIFADDNLGNPLLDSLKNSSAKSSSASRFNNAEQAQPLESLVTITFLNMLLKCTAGISHLCKNC